MKTKHPINHSPVVDPKNTTNSDSFLSDMDSRMRHVFRSVVENYLQNGVPVGSRTLTRTLRENISPATVRNVMQDLEYLGLLNSPHISAGRLPTELGLRIFIDGLLEVDDISTEARDKLDSVRSHSEQGGLGDSLQSVMNKVGNALSEVTHGASLVLVPKHEAPIEHIELVHLHHRRAIVVLVFADGHVENRVLTIPKGQTMRSLSDAVEYINGCAQGMTLSEVRTLITTAINDQQAEIAKQSRILIDSGVAVCFEKNDIDERLLVRGRSNLLSAETVNELDRIKHLFDDLERKRDITKFLELTETSEGVRIFIGSENKLFSLSASSMVVAPYKNDGHKIVGAVGIIGPTRLNYGKIVPIVRYTANVLSSILSDREREPKEESYDQKQ